MSMIKKILAILPKSDKYKMGILIVFIFVGSFFELLGISIVLPIINCIMDDRKIDYLLDIINEIFMINVSFDKKNIMVILFALVIFVYLIKNLYLILMNKWIQNFTYDSQEKMAKNLLKSYIKKPYQYYCSVNTAVLQRSINFDVVYFYVVVLNLLQLLVEAMICIVLGIYLSATNLFITLMVLLSCAIAGLCFFYFSKDRSKKAGKESQFHNGMIMKWVNQSIEGIKEVKLLKREKFFLKQFDFHYAIYAEHTKNFHMLQIMPKYVVETACIIGIMMVLIIEVFRMPTLSDLIPQLTVFALAAFRLLPSVTKISAHITTILYYKPSVDLVYDDLEYIEDTDEVRCADYCEEMEFKECIEVKNLYFRYDNVEDFVISDCNLKINKGESVAFIGKSGAGKSTMVDIILGLLTPTNGEILVDGISINKSSDKWFRKCGYVPQNIFLMDDSIRNNIAFGIDSEHIDDNKIFNAIRLASLEDFVLSLENGINTNIGERGIRLSGGQRQRIGIARALYNNPDVLVLDEATSALDDETEKEVMASIERLKGIKTLIIIAHRLSTIEKCDKKFSVGDGKVENL